MTPEGKVKSMVKAVLRDAGAVFVMPVTRGFGVSGTPDFVVCLPPAGRYVLIETKAKGNKARPLQAAQINRAVKAGAVGLVVGADAGRLVAASAAHDEPLEEIHGPPESIKTWLRDTLERVKRNEV